MSSYANQKEKLYWFRDQISWLFDEIKALIYEEDEDKKMTPSELLNFAMQIQGDFYKNTRKSNRTPKAGSSYSKQAEKLKVVENTLNMIIEMIGIFRHDRENKELLMKQYFEAFKYYVWKAY